MWYGVLKVNKNQALIHTIHLNTNIRMIQNISSVQLWRHLVGEQ